ncbi:hypothetical protein GEMRC1_009405 [Eukaryota sp. GEM-RC1]
MAFSRSEDMYREKIAELEHRLDKHASDKDQKSEEVIRLSEEVSKLKQSLSSSTRSCRALEQELSLTKSSMHRLRSGISSSKSWVTKLMVMMPGLESSAMAGCEALSMCRELADRNRQVSREHSNLTVENETLYKSVSDYEQIVSDLQSKVAARSVDGIDSEVLKLKRDNSELAGQLHETHSMLSEVESTLSTLENIRIDYETVKKERDELLKNVKKLHHKYDLLTGNHRDLTEKYSTTKKRLKTTLALVAKKEAMSNSKAEGEVSMRDTQPVHHVSTIESCIQTDSPSFLESRQKSPKVKHLDVSPAIDPEVFDLRARLSREKSSSQLLSEKLKELHDAFSLLQSEYSEKSQEFSEQSAQKDEKINQLSRQLSDLQSKLHKKSLDQAPILLVESIAALSKTERARLAASLNLSGSSKSFVLAQELSRLVMNNDGPSEKILAKVLDVIQSLSGNQAREIVDVLIGFKNQSGEMSVNTSRDHSHIDSVLAEVISFLKEVPSVLSQTLTVTELTRNNHFTVSWKSIDQLKTPLIDCFDQVLSLLLGSSSDGAKLSHIKSLLRQHISSLSNATTELFDNSNEDALKAALSLLSRTQATFAVALQLDDDDSDGSEYLDNVDESLLEFRSNAIEELP